MIRAGRRCLRKWGATPGQKQSESVWIDPEFDLFGGVAQGWNEQTQAKECLLAGAAGTGKTLCNLLRVYWTSRLYPGARCLIVRKTRESLTETVLVTWERDILGSSHPILTTRPNLRRVRQSYHFPNGSEVVCGGIDKPDKILSSEYDLIYCPESTDFEKEDWETLGTRLRSGVVPYQMQIGDCNPTSPEHWLYKRCVDPPNTCKLIPTRHQDNPRFWSQVTNDWTPAGLQYLDRLGNLTGTRRDRFLFGKWVAAEGAIYDFNSALTTDDPPGHCVPESWQAPPRWKRLWSIDWGLSKPTCLQVWAIEEFPSFPDGTGNNRMYLVREIYRPRQRADELGQWVRDNWLDPGVEPLPWQVICDVSPGRGSEKDAEDAKTLFEKKSGLYLRIADKGEREKGIRETQARFDRQEDGLPRILFRRKALAHEPDQALLNKGLPTSTTSELPGYVWDTTRLADVPIDENDHGCFVAGTSVETKRGVISIEDIRADGSTGDWVWTSHGWRPVVGANMTNPRSQVMRVNFGGPLTVRYLIGTADHPIYVRGSGWARMDALKKGDGVVTSDERLLQVREIIPLAEPAAVYNLAVGNVPSAKTEDDDASNYFANGILVHNCDAMRYAVTYVNKNAGDTSYPRPTTTIQEQMEAACLGARKQLNAVMGRRRW